jgi:hypothetical protein
VPRFDAHCATCRVYTWKEGALSALGHDLELAVERFTIEVGDDRSVDARFDPGSLRLRGASVGGRIEAMSPSDRDKIERAIVDEVLAARAHPEIRFQAGPARPRADGGFDLDGQLTLHGVPRPLAARLCSQGGRLVTEVTLHQPDFGIRPYRAMLGALRIKSDVRVRIDVPTP